jgi:hypothetical protein
MRKIMPEQAKGAANGLSVQKVFDKLDGDGDGIITAAEAGPRFGHGVLAQLLALQAQDPVDAGVTDDAATSTQTSEPLATDAGDPTDGEGAVQDSSAADPGSDPAPSSDPTGDATDDLETSLTTPPPIADATSDPTLLLDPDVA